MRRVRIILQDLVRNIYFYFGLGFCFCSLLGPDSGQGRRKLDARGQEGLGQPAVARACRQTTHICKQHTHVPTPGTPTDRRRSSEKQLYSSAAPLNAIAATADQSTNQPIKQPTAAAA